MVSRADINFCFMALEEAIKSKLHSKHGVIITKGKKIVASGYNNNRCLVNGKMVICLHAEIDAILRWRSRCFKEFSNSNRKDKKIIDKISRKENNFTMYVVRENKNIHDKEKPFSYSKPCADCCQKLLECNFKKIVYTTGDKSIAECMRKHQITNSNFTHATKTLKKNTNNYNRLIYI